MKKTDKKKKMLNYLKSAQSQSFHYKVDILVVKGFDQMFFSDLTCDWVVSGLIPRSAGKIWVGTVKEQRFYLLHHRRWRALEQVT